MTPSSDEIYWLILSVNFSISQLSQQKAFQYFWSWQLIHSITLSIFYTIRITPEIKYLILFKSKTSNCHLKNTLWLLLVPQNAAEHAWTTETLKRLRFLTSPRMISALWKPTTYKVTEHINRNSNRYLLKKTTLECSKTFYKIQHFNPTKLV